MSALLSSTSDRPAKLALNRLSLISAIFSQAVLLVIGFSERLIAGNATGYTGSDGRWCRVHPGPTAMAITSVRIAGRERARDVWLAMSLSSNMTYLRSNCASAGAVPVTANALPAKEGIIPARF
jgi:hypothetical protein